MAVAIRGQDTAITGSFTTSHSADLTGIGHQAGDLLVLAIELWNSGVMNTPPANWDVLVNGVQGNNVRLYVYTRVSNGTETAAAFTTTGNERAFSMAVGLYENTGGTLVLGTPGTIGDGTADGDIDYPSATGGTTSDLAIITLAQYGTVSVATDVAVPNYTRNYTLSLGGSNPRLNFYTRNPATTTSLPGGVVSGANSAYVAAAHFSVTAVPPDEPPSNDTPPAVTGVELVGETLTTDDGTWSGTEPITFSYQWESCPDQVFAEGTQSIGTDADTYVLTEDEEDLYIRCVVTASNSVDDVDEPSNIVGPIEGLDGGFSSVMFGRRPARILRPLGGRRPGLG
jgi:hypothetical protein